MSYDVSVGELNFNYTYNLSKLFYDHIPEESAKGGLSEIDGKTGDEVFHILRNALDRIDTTRLRMWDDFDGDADFCKQYDSSNQWGSTVGAILFLSLIMAACAMNHDEIVRVS